MENNNETTNVAPDLWGDSLPVVHELTPPTQPVEEPPVAQAVTEPVAEQTPETPTNEPAPVTPQAEIIEKVVEKIIEKQPEFKDELSKGLYEALSSGDQTAIDKYYEYVSVLKKDYQSMSDIDSIKEQLKVANPSWNSKDIDIEIRTKYGKIPAKIDLDSINPDLNPNEYNEALKQNELVEEKELLLSRDARDARYALEASKKTIELPKLKTPEPQAQQPEYTPEQISEFNRQWEASVKEAIPNLSDLKFKIGDEEITYKATEEEKQEFTALMNDFDDVAYLTKRGWYNEQGQINILQVAEDVRKLEKIDKIVASAATQMKTNAKKEVVSEIKQIDLAPTPSSPDLSMDLAAKVWNN